MNWTPEAQARLQQVPEGVMRELTRQRVERLAYQLGRSAVTGELMDAKYRQWAGGSAHATSELVWTEEARKRVERIPVFVKGMVVQAVEAYARSQQLTEISPSVLDQAKSVWGEGGRFHSREETR